MSSQPPTRSLTVLVVPANTPEVIDAMTSDARREAGWTRIDLVHAGEPATLLRRALDLDLGVHEGRRAWDEGDSSVVATSLVTADHLEHVVGVLAPHVADPRTLASRLVRAAGSGEDPARVGRALGEQLVEPAGGPAEEAAAYVRMFCAHAPEAVRLAMGIAWEYRTPAACACAVWDGMTYGEVRAFPRSQFVGLESRETGLSDRAGRLRCTGCRATFAFISTTTYTEVTREPPRATLELGEDEIDRVIAGIRDGAQVVVGGSRAHTTYFGRNGELLIEDFDEGATTERTCAEADLRELIAGSPAEFLEVLRRPLREVLRRTLVGAANVAPDPALRDLIVYGECLSHRHLLEAVIDWPEAAEAPALSAEAAAELVALRDGVDVYHFIRSAVGYETSTPATGRFGLRVFATLAEMLGRELPRWRRYRADFRAMAGDSAGAVEDLEWERTHLPADDDDRPYLERAIAKLADTRILAEIAAAPDDDAPRLVWADILTERGDPRGELIVAQCRTSRLDMSDPERASLMTRVLHLLALHGRAWGKRGYGYDRGFVDSIEVRWVTSAADLDEAFALSPRVQGLRFRTYRGDMMEDPARVLDDPRLEQIVQLDFTTPVFTLDGPGGETVYPFGPQIVRRLAGRFPNLRELTIRGAELSVEDVGLIGPRPKLRTLELGEVPMRGATAALLGAGGFDELRVLELDQCQLGDDDVTPFARLRALEELDLDDNSIGDRGARTLAGLGLRHLHLAGSAIGDDGAAALGAASKLVMLDVDRSAVGNAGVSRIAGLELACLTLGTNPFDEAAVSALARGRVARTLRRLSLGPFGERRLGGEVARLLAGMPRLWQLLLRGCEIDGDGAVALLDGLPSLRAIALGHCAIDDSGLAKIVAHPAFARLDVLELGHNQLGPDAGAILARAPRLPARIFLNGNRLGDVGARALAEAPAAGRVADLILQDNAITDEGARALLGESSQLVAAVARLCLHDNAIGAEVAQACTDQLGPRFCFSGPASP